MKPTILSTQFNPRGASVVVRTFGESGKWPAYMKVIHNLNDYDEWSFCRMRDEESTLADWVSEDTANWTIGEEGIAAGKAACLKAERRMKKARATFKKTELYAAMEREVNQTVTSYRDDFFMHDCTRLGLMLLDGKEIDKFRWYLRDSGTWIFQGDISATEHEVIKEKRHRIFHYDGARLREQTRGAVYELRPWYSL